VVNKFTKNKETMKIKMKNTMETVRHTLGHISVHVIAALLVGFIADACHFGLAEAIGHSDR
jgi:hypothetical protein